MILSDNVKDFESFLLDNGFDKIPVTDDLPDNIFCFKHKIKTLRVDMVFNTEMNPGISVHIVNKETKYVTKSFLITPVLDTIQLSDLKTELAQIIEGK